MTAFTDEERAKILAAGLPQPDEWLERYKTQPIKARLDQCEALLFKYARAYLAEVTECGRLREELRVAQEALRIESDLRAQDIAMAREAEAFARSVAHREGLEASLRAILDCAVAECPNLTLDQYAIATRVLSKAAEAVKALAAKAARQPSKQDHCEDAQPSPYRSAPPRLADLLGPDESDDSTDVTLDCHDLAAIAEECGGGSATDADAGDES